MPSRRRPRRAAATSRASGADAALHINSRELPETGQAVPDLLEVLESVSTCAGSVSDFSGSEPATVSDLGSQIHVRLAAIVRMVTQFSHAEPETGMPFEWARQTFCRMFDLCAAIAGVQH